MYNATVCFSDVIDEIKAVSAIEALGAKWRRNGKWYFIKGMNMELRDTVYELSARFYAW